MAVINTTITLKSSRSKVLHRSVGKKFSVRITTFDGVPVESIFQDPPIFLHKMIGGTIPSLAQATNFLFMPGGQCVPVGSIRGTLRENLGTDEALIGYTVRTGNDVQ